MNQTISSENILNALKNTSKGRLSYDRHWKEERRTQEIMNDIKLKTSSLTISPKTLEMQPKVSKTIKYKVIQSSTKETTHSLNSSQNEDIDRNDKSLRKTSSHKNAFNDSTNDFELALYEKQRQESVAQELNKKRQLFESEFKKYEESRDQSMKLIRQKSILEMTRKTNSFVEDYKALKDSILTKQLTLEDNPITTNSKLKEIESKHQLLVEEQHRKQIEIKRKDILLVRNEIDSVVKNCLLLGHSLENNEKTVPYFNIFKQDLNSMIGLLQNIDILLNKSDLSDSDINSAQTIKLGVDGLKTKIVSDITQLKNNIQNTNTIQPVVHNIKTNDSVAQSSEPLSKFVDSNAFKDFLKLQKFSNDFENSFKHFATEVNYKQKRNDLQLFVRTTINTISCESVDHIRDKLNRLTLLFSEKNVEYSGKQLKCNSKDGSLSFCISLASKMFISVCTKQKDIELSMAPIVVLLWSRFPTFGQIFMAQMQEKCPYLVPYYPEKDPDDNEGNYLIACGYTITKDGTPETEESFLNRMRAMVKLYSAIIQSNVESGHPHSLKYGWFWTARLLNLEPRPAITAAILEAFLSIISHKFYRFYGKQFVKIIVFIQNDYIKRIESVSQKGTKRQSLVKLQMFIDEVINKIKRRANHNQIMPEGIIPDYFFSKAFSNSRGFSFNS